MKKSLIKIKALLPIHCSLNSHNNKIASQYTNDQTVFEKYVFVRNFENHLH